MIKITQDKLSKWVGITDQTLRNWRKGKINIAKKNLYKSLTIGYYLNTKEGDKTPMEIFSQSVEKLKYIANKKCNSNETKDILNKEIEKLEKIEKDLGTLNKVDG